MSGFERAVLSQVVTDRIAGRKVLAAAFLTFEFDPAFFELEVLPTLFDEAYSHEPELKLRQLEEAMRGLVVPIAVYYDRNGLRAASGGSQLEIQRVPVRHGTGIFHPKNVFVLVEGPVQDDGVAPKSLLVVTMSANLTRSGWWENVECCHVEEIAAGGKTWLKEPLQQLLRRVRERTSAPKAQPAIDCLLRFLRGTVARQRDGSASRFVAFWAGDGRFVDFLQQATRGGLAGCNLEVLSPFFDDAATCAPLQDLIDAFRPEKVRVLLPEVDGVATCAPGILAAIDAMPDVAWGGLPEDFLRRGRSDSLGIRRVHAKVYRFFRRSPRRELVFVGSPNLTRAAFQNGGNWETGILVELDPAKAPDFWLEELTTAPTAGVHEGEAGDAATSRGSPLQVRYHWGTDVAEAFWDEGKPSGRLQLSASGSPLGALADLPPCAWRKLDDATAAALRARLFTTSLLQVREDDGEPQYVLVQEEGMARRPSMLPNLSVADILRFWSLLTTASRTAFVAERGRPIAGATGDPLPRPPLPASNGMFERFAGIFHAFGGFERSVRAALADAEQPERVAELRLFGSKHDSLGHLLDRAFEEPQLDDVSRYVLWLCAQQAWQQLGREFPDFFAAHRPAADAVAKRLERVDGLRERLVAADGDGMRDFLRWFEPHFLRRATVAEEGA